MDFYNITDRYIQYLKQYDDKVAINKRETRPYIGIVFKIEEIEYFAPFSSPKPKHEKMRNGGVDYRKIDSGKLGIINFNNMIPVPHSELIPLIFDNIKDKKYKTLLQNQYEHIERDEEGILKTAKNLYRIVTSIDELNSFYQTIRSRSCNFKLLEEKCREYEEDRV